MTPQQNQRVRELFYQALDRPGADRAAWVHSQCADDAAVAHEVIELLAQTHGDSVAGFPLDAEPADPPAPRDELVGRTFGKYHLESVLGQGGMGVVYKARDRQLARDVAVKIVRPGATSAETRRRFESEGAILARLQHPGIAQIFDSGIETISGAGRPFLVMEIVTGVAIVASCERRAVSLPDRLGLLALVADAVQHAHDRGVIHRDLKPANVLVDSQGVPKILDFGIARMVQADAADPGFVHHTATGLVLGTLQYMSPEQADGIAEVTTRSDVYSLGMILHEMVAGAPPYSVKGKSLTETLRLIKDFDPPPLKLVAVPRSESSTARPQSSSLSASQVRDLELIIRKALMKDPLRRYSGAGALAADLRRLLTNEPIEAHPPTTAYLIRKFTQKRKPLVLSAAAVVAALLLGLATTIWQARVANDRAAEASIAKADAQRLADEQITLRERAESMVTFIEDTLRRGDPSSGGKSDMTVAEAMDRAAASIEAGNKFSRDPATEAALRELIAKIHVSFGRYKPAELLLDRAVKLRESLSTVDGPELAWSLNALASVRQDLGKYNDARALYERALAMRERLYPDGHADVAFSLNDLAQLSTALGDHEKTEDYYRRALTMLERFRPGDDPDVAMLLSNLANELSTKGRVAEAEPLFERGLAMQRACFKGLDHPDLVVGLNNVGLCKAKLGRTAAAEPLFREALELSRRAYGNDHHLTASCLNNVAGLLQDLGRLDEADPLYRECLAIRRKVLPASHPDIPLTLNNLASLLSSRRDFEGAEAMYLDALELRRHNLPDVHPGIAMSLNNLAKARLMLGKNDLALAESEEAAVRLAKVHPSGSPQRAVVLSTRALVLDTVGRYEEAAAIIAQAEAMVQATERPPGQAADRVVAVKRELESRGKVRK